MTEPIFHLDKRKDVTPSTMTSSAGSRVRYLALACKTGHYWTTEQQTGHRVCAVCNACEGGCSA